MLGRTKSDFYSWLESFVCGTILIIAISQNLSAAPQESVAHDVLFQEVKQSIVATVKSQDLRGTLQWSVLSKTLQESPGKFDEFLSAIIRLGFIRDAADIASENDCGSVASVFSIYDELSQRQYDMVDANPHMINQNLRRVITSYQAIVLHKQELLDEVREAQSSCVFRSRVQFAPTNLLSYLRQAWLQDDSLPFHEDLYIQICELCAIEKQQLPKPNGISTLHDIYLRPFIGINHKSVVSSQPDTVETMLSLNESATTEDRPRSVEEKLRGYRSCCNFLLFLLSEKNNPVERAWLLRAYEKELERIRDVAPKDIAEIYRAFAVASNMPLTKSNLKPFSLRLFEGMPQAEERKILLSIAKNQLYVERLFDLSETQVRRAAFYEKVARGIDRLEQLKHPVEMVFEMIDTSELEQAASQDIQLCMSLGRADAMAIPTNLEIDNCEDQTLRGIFLMKAGRFSEAGTNMRDRVRENPFSVTNLSWLAQYYLETGEHEKAMKLSCLCHLMSSDPHASLVLAATLHCGLEDSTRFGTAIKNEVDRLEYAHFVVSLLLNAEEANCSIMGLESTIQTCFSLIDDEKIDSSELELVVKKVEQLARGF